MFAKLAYENGLTVTRFILIRHLNLFVLSYLYGKFFQGIDFDLRKHDGKSIKFLFIRAVISMISKTCQYSAIAMIPLALSSTISFTTGPVFAALLAFVLIREKLNVQEGVTIALGIVGTTMLTMPQWFRWMHLDAESIDDRLDEDLTKYNWYYLGIFIALFSAALDTVVYYIIRKIGMKVPGPIISFISGGFTSLSICLYCFVYEPFNLSYFWADFDTTDWIEIA